jgi:HEAT repeat protein
MGTQPQSIAEPANPASFTKRKRARRFKRSIRASTIIPVLVAVPLLGALHFARMRGPWINWENQAAAGTSVKSLPDTVSSSDSGLRKKDEVSVDLPHLTTLLPQQQAELLLQHAINHDDSAVDVIRRRVDGWRGHLRNTGKLFDLVIDALNTDDLRVRTAAVEIDLAANNLSKSRESISLLVHRLENEPARRPFALWRLGALGNRGVEPETVLSHLLRFQHDRDEQTRYWVIEGLAMLGTDASVDPLLESLAHDPSERIRERAAHNLGISGMLTKQQRITAVPDLLNFADDDSLDAATRAYIFQALRDISGQSFGDNPSAWRNWWVHHDNPMKHSRRTGLLQTEFLFPSLGREVESTFRFIKSVARI